MKKYIFAALAICSFFSGTVNALGMSMSECTVIDASGSPVTIDSLPSGGSATVQFTNNKAICHGSLPDNAVLPSNRAIVLTPDDSDEKCDITGVGQVDDWHLVITKSGQVTLTCNI